MAEKDLLDLEFDEDTMKLMRQATSSPVKKAIVAAFVNGLDMRAITEQEEKTKHNAENNANTFIFFMILLLLFF